MAEAGMAYTKLVERMREIALVNSTGNLLSWDQETFMPARALGYRAEQLAYLKGWAHRQFVDPAVGGWLSDCEGKLSDPVESANVRELRRDYARQTCLTSELVETFERTTALARDAWVNARRSKQFEMFSPHLEKVIGLSRQMAEAWGYEESPYDALLEGYEPGIRAGELRRLFDTLRPELVRILDLTRADEGLTASSNLEGSYPLPGQEAFNREVAEAFGFDFESGRIDTTTHPFCSGLAPGDCRLTTRYSATDFTESFYSVLHETGHGLYEQGLPGADFGLPSGSAVSLGIHESQSRLWENHVGRGAEFWAFWHERAAKHLPELNRFAPGEIRAGVNQVRPSFIRVEADEVTYDLHIMLRFGAELRLIEGELAVADLPAYWNEGFEKLLGLRVKDDAQGCLQDIHWSMGGFGYFPTYTLGNLNASQLMQRAGKHLPDLGAEIASGQYANLLGWLRTNVHGLGRQLSSQDLMRRVTGSATTPEPHLEYLRAKFGGAKS